jgi:hypothetical protein
MEQRLEGMRTDTKERTKQLGLVEDFQPLALNSPALAAGYSHPLMNYWILQNYGFAS